MQIAEVVHVEGATPPQQEQQTQTVNTEQVNNTGPVTETTTPVVQEPVVQQQTAAADYSWLEKHNIKSESDFANFTQGWQQKVQELENRQPVSPYKTEFAKVADELSSRGVKPETIARFSGLKPTEMGAKSAILTKLEVEFPTLSPTEREAYFEEEYGGVDNEESILTEGQKAARRVKLEKDGATAREVLGQFIYEAFNPNQVAPEVQQKEQSRQTFWANEGIGKISTKNEVKLPSTIKLPGQNGAVESKPFDFVYQIPAEATQALLKEFSETVKNPMFGNYFDQSEAGINNANATYNKMLWGNYGEQILNRAMEHASQRESAIHEHYAKLLNNTNFKGLSTDVSTDRTVTADMGMAAFLKKSGR